MKRTIIAVITLIVISFVTAIASAQSVTSYALPDSLSSGDTFNYVITASYQTTQFSAYYPDEESFSDAFEFRGVQRFKGSIAQDSIVYRLQFFGVKDTVLTGKQVLFVQGQDTLALETAPVPIYFKSNLESEAGELKPFKPIFDFTRSWLMFFLAGLLLAFLAYLVWRYRDRFLHKGPETEIVDPTPIPPYVSPFAEFEKSLRELKQIEKYSSDEGLMKWHVQLSNAIRTYLEHTHGIEALEMTTREIHKAMTAGKMHPDVTVLSLEVLSQCDLVKFAKLTVDTHKAFLAFEKTEKLRDLFRFLDENTLRELKYQYEMKHGLRQEKASQADKNRTESAPETINEIKSSEES